MFLQRPPLKQGTFNVAVLSLHCSFEHEDKGAFEFNFDEMWCRKTDPQNISTGSFQVALPDTWSHVSFASKLDREGLARKFLRINFIRTPDQPAPDGSWQFNVRDILSVSEQQGIAKLTRNDKTLGNVTLRICMTQAASAAVQQAVADQPLPLASLTALDVAAVPQQRSDASVLFIYLTSKLLSITASMEPCWLIGAVNPTKKR